MTGFLTAIWLLFADFRTGFEAEKPAKPPFYGQQPWPWGLRLRFGDPGRRGYRSRSGVPETQSDLCVNPR